MASTYILVDGENIDATLGTCILKHQPRPEERPRWDRVLNYEVFDTDVESDPENEDPEDPTRGLFYLNASFHVASNFIQALLAIGWRPILLTSEDPEIKIVDVGIQKTLEAIIKDRPGANVVLASHDADFIPQIRDLLDAGHEVAVMCFREFLSIQLAQLEERGLVIIDLEHDVNAFNVPLQRLAPVDIAAFDPYQYI